MTTELKITVYKEPTEYKATDDVYVQLALHGKRYMCFEKGQILKIEHKQRPPNQGNDYWCVFVLLDIEPTKIMDGYSQQLIPIIHEPWLQIIKVSHEENEKLRTKFSDIEEGYKRAIRAMAEKK